MAALAEDPDDLPCPYSPSHPLLTLADQLDNDGKNLGRRSWGVEGTIDPKI
jgi:hypothetical protein